MADKTPDRGSLDELDECIAKLEEVLNTCDLRGHSRAAISIDLAIDQLRSDRKRLAEQGDHGDDAAS